MVTLSLTAEIEKKLAERAVACGQTAEEFASRLVTQAISSPTLDEVLAPVRKRFEATGMSKEELSELLESEKHAMREERRSRRAS